jgi:IPT/TIG domain
MKFSYLLIALIVPIFVQSNAVFGQPLVTGVTPNRGSTAGGTPVTITGSDFTDATDVTFGGRAAQSFTVVNSSTIQAQTPVSTIGAAQVAVISSSGVSPANSPDDLFVYAGVWFAYATNTDDGTVTVTVLPTILLDLLFL